MKNKMKNLTFIILVVLTFTSCVKESQVFTPDPIPDPITNLRSILATNSSSFAVKNNLDARIVTDSKSEIYVDAHSFIRNTENLDVNIILKYSELQNYSDFLIQAVDHQSDLGFTNTMFSFHIDAQLASTSIDLHEEGKIRVRIPSDELEDELFIGKGSFEDGQLIWNYSLSDINSDFEYISWEEIDANGGIKLRTGYEISVKETGWYSFVSVIDSPTSLEVPLCFQYPNTSVYNAQNTTAFILLKDQKFMSTATINVADNNYCTVDLPHILNTEVKLVSISYFQNSDSYHYLYPY